MESFVVMHNPNNHLGKLEHFIRDFTSKEPQRPCSFTSLYKTAHAAAKVNTIYVVGWQVIGNEKIYELGYKFVSTINIPAPKDKPHQWLWKFKNSVSESDEIKGFYFDMPLIINSPAVMTWFGKKDNLMKEIPPYIADELDKIFKDNSAKSFS